MSNSIAKTAYYCCGVRMADAVAPNSICKDSLAGLFMDQEAKAFLKQFDAFGRQNASTVARHAIIDDLLREWLRRNSASRIFVIGAGFDTRAYRLKGGDWIEFDEPEVMAEKETHLPWQGAPNPLVRVPVRFASESLEDKMAPYAGDDEAVVVVEGVSMYLSDSELKALATIIKSRLPNATLVIDIMTEAFYRRYSRKLFERFRALGISCQTAEQGHSVDELRAEGYRLVQQISIIGHAIAAGNFRLPMWLFRALFRTLRTGYSVCVFQADAGEQV